MELRSSAILSARVVAGRSRRAEAKRAGFMGCDSEDMVGGCGCVCVCEGVVRGC